jgi:predicted DsbA family dithiol-disulfide isomerase
MMIPWPPERRAAARANFERLARELHPGLELNPGERTHWYDSTPAHEAAEWAREQGQDDALRRGVFRAYFVEDRNIGSPEVLAQVARQVGLAEGDLRSALAEHRYLERVRAQYEEARALGVSSVPTFVADGYAVIGAQPLEVFRRLMAAVGLEPRERQPTQ